MAAVHGNPSAREEENFTHKRVHPQLAHHRHLPREPLPPALLSGDREREVAKALPGLESSVSGELHRAFGRGRLAGTEVDTPVLFSGAQNGTWRSSSGEGYICMAVLMAFQIHYAARGWQGAAESLWGAGAEVPKARFHAEKEPGGPSLCRLRMDRPPLPESNVTSDDGQPEVVREASRRLSREQISILISAASINLGSMMCYSILGPFFPNEAEKKDVSNTVIGMIFGCFALFNLLSSLLFGKYLVQIGAKFMFVAGMFVSGGATVLFGMLDRAPDGPIFITMCFLVRVVDAISFAAAITASFSLLAKAFPNNVATVMGSLEIFSGLGLVLGPPLGGFLYQTFGYEVPFIFLGCLVLLMVPLNMCILPNYDASPSEHSFWKLVTLPKVVLISFVIISLSGGFGFLDPTLSLFVLNKFNLSAGYVGLVFLGLALSYSISSPLFGLLSDKVPYLRKWLLVSGNIITAVCYMLLGPVPILHIKSQLWLLVLVLVVNGVSAGMSIIPTFPEVLSCAYENGFEEGLSTLGLVSGLFGAMWSLGAFIGPTLGGFLYEKIGFEWAAAIQGLWALITGLAMGLFYIQEHWRRKRYELQNTLSTEEEREERTSLLPHRI
ncbi:MFS-type transporter SLC18B1 [Gracilinanus agilis]|uniref:MFS-type transporter SLC18B1 n=1 Tax=Gracilinanus agilis TaxID=191870 RepID=UPI001CFED843|nr:MFS-type transporter SLC18B1 [Gracilinanus agilis]